MKVMKTQEKHEGDTRMESLANLELPIRQAEQVKAGVLARHEGAFMGNLFSATPVA
jgi:hypothetical protein